MLRPTYHDTMFLSYKYHDIMPWLVVANSDNVTYRHLFGRDLIVTENPHG